MVEKGTSTKQDSDIAIIGMACKFPKALTLGDYWQNILHKVDAIVDTPADRWNVETFYDPKSVDGTRVCAKRGGFLESPFPFDPARHGVMPVSVEGGEPDQFLVLKVAVDALNDAGYLNRLTPETRVEFILGRGNFFGAGNINLYLRTLGVEQTLSIVERTAPHLSPEELEAIRKAFFASLYPFGPETAPAVMPSLTAGRVANRLGFTGPAYTLDAACASSLVAIESAVRDLISGSCDLALAGGIHTATSVPFLSVFSALGALSRRDAIRPFDRRADGLLPGEGVGFVVLKRKSEAERDGDRIYAIVKGVASTSDGRGTSLNSPSPKGQSMAIRDALDQAGISPDTIGLIEAHGTGTPVGDAVEIEALRMVFGQRIEGEARKCALGSVKSMIGHAMPAAGIAGFIKATLALYCKILPPTLHCEEPNPKFRLEETPFYVNSETRPWIHGNPDTPRRAGVSAFGFGGINAHAILEEYRTEPRIEGYLTIPWDKEVFLFGGSSRDDLLARLEETLRFLQETPSGDLPALSHAFWRKLTGSFSRLSVVAGSAADLKSKLEHAIEKISVPSCTKIKDIRGIYFFSTPLGRDGKVAFMFPGEGSSYSNMMIDLCLHFPQVRACFDHLDRIVASRKEVCRFLPSHFSFPAPSLTEKEYGELEKQFWQVDSGLQSILAANFAAERLLNLISVRPDMFLGHSAGEYSAWIASGIVAEKDLLRKQEALSALYKGGAKEQETAMLVVSTNRERMEDLLKETGGGIYVSNDNCPHQVVVVGTHEGIDRLSKAVKAKGIMAERLPSTQAHHTPYSERHAARLRKIFSSMNISSPRTRIYSPTIASAYPDDHAEILSLMVDYWLKPLEFRKTIEAMYREGTRIFIETGAGKNLVGFVEDTLRGKPHLAVSVDNRRKSGMEQLCHLIGLLAAHHVPLDLDPLFRARGMTEPLSASTVPDGQTAHRKEVLLPLGLPGLRLPDSFVPRKPTVEREAPAKIRQDREASARTTSTSGKHKNREGAPSDRHVRQSVPGSGENGIPPSAMKSYLANMNSFLEIQKDVLNAYLSRKNPSPRERKQGNQPAGKLPFVGEILSIESGRRCIVRRRIDLREDLFLYDHPFGGSVSDSNLDLHPLIILPLTIGVEIMAEAASVLFPGLVPVSVRDVRASQWIEIEDDGPTTLTVEAIAGHQGSNGANVGIYVEDRTPGSRKSPGRIPAFQATVFFSADYERLPYEEISGCREDQASASRSADEVYRMKYMPHGKKFQVLASLGTMTEKSLLSQLRVPAEQDFFASMRSPRMLTGPFVLDACAQSVGYWAQKNLEEGFVTFPIGAREIQFFGPPPSADEMLDCRMRIREIDSSLVHADIDIKGTDGRIWTKVRGWMHRRFVFPADLCYFLKFPSEVILGKELSVEGAEPWAPGDVSCFRSRHYPDIDSTIWKKAAAYLYLNHGERKTYQAQATRTQEGNLWLAGRMAAKDAIRGLLRRRSNIECYPADIEIDGDSNGKPAHVGRWMGDPTSVYRLAVSYVDEFAFAVAADSNRIDSLGVQVQPVEVGEGVREAGTFDPRELGVLETVPPASRAEWATRFACAKKAAREAVAANPAFRPENLVVSAYDKSGGTIRLRAADELPDKAGMLLLDAFTYREADYIFAVCFVKRS